MKCRGDDSRRAGLGERRACRGAVMRLGALLLLAALAASGCHPQPQEITVLAVNDFHGALARGGVDAKSGREWG